MDKKIFYKLSYGLYVIGSTNEGRFNGQIANTVFQISSEPYTIAISINKRNLTNEFIKASKVFSVSILPKSVPLDFIGRFGFRSGRDTVKYQDISYKQGVTGAPVLLEHAIGYIEASVINSLDIETHTLFIAKVTDGELFNNEEMMTYDYYHQVKSGSLPRSDSINNESKKGHNRVVEINEANNTNRYQCRVCGFVYDTAKGDPDSNITPGTPFEKIISEWTCPVCGVEKDQFEAID